MNIKFPMRQTQHAKRNPLLSPFFKHQRALVGCLALVASMVWLTSKGELDAAEPPVSDGASGEIASAARGVERIVAHRGSSLQRPENTIAAFEHAIEVGATAVEIDVRTSRDGKLVIMHDDTVSRTTNGTGRVNDLSWAELAAMDAGSWFATEYASERVPSLEQVLKLCHGRIDVQLDLKEVGEVYADRIAAAVKAYGEPARTTAAVRTVEQARQLKERLPEISTLIFLRKQEQTDAFLAAGLDYLRPQVHWIAKDPSLLRRIRQGGAKIHFDATVGTSEKVMPLLIHRPESLLTDDPMQLIKTLAELQQ